jgi:hypothetical protein
LISMKQERRGYLTGDESSTLPPKSSKISILF